MSEGLEVWGQGLLVQTLLVEDRQKQIRVVAALRARADLLPADEHVVGI